MFRELLLEGRLDQALYEASERTGQAFGELVEAGLEPLAAWEAVREDWAFLRAEPDSGDDVLTDEREAIAQNESSVVPTRCGAIAGDGRA